MSSKQEHGGPRGAFVNIYRSEDWILKLISGETIVGYVVHDDDGMVVLDRPRKLTIPHNIFGGGQLNVSDLDCRSYQQEDRIYIEKTAISYWAKPNNNAYR